MSAVQLDLFTDEQPADPPLYADTICTGCGAVCRNEVEGGAGASWNPAMLFGYAAIKAHQKAGCPGDTPTAKAARLRLLTLLPTHEQIPPGSVRYADLTTSIWDARAALMLALGRTLESGTA